MTLIGIWLTEPGRAFAWCDDECFLHNFVGPPTPSGHIHKMAVNDEAEAVVVTMGDKLLIDIAAEVVARSIVFDLLADALAVQARLHWYPIEGIESARALVVGYSHRLGRFVGFELASGDKFQPRRVLTMTAFPYCPEAESSFRASPLICSALPSYRRWRFRRSPRRRGEAS